MVPRPPIPKYLQAYHKPTALTDVILRCADGNDWPACKVDLIRHSAVLERRLCTKVFLDHVIHEGPPDISIVHLTCDSITLGQLLACLDGGFCLPFYLSIEELVRMLCLAHEFMMVAVVNRLDISIAERLPLSLIPSWFFELAETYHLPHLLSACLLGLSIRTLSFASDKNPQDVVYGVCNLGERRHTLFCKYLTSLLQRRLEWSMQIEWMALYIKAHRLAESIEMEHHHDLLEYFARGS